ncbi:MAG TPA: TlpA disulfide reductase family protein [Cellvibrio sp.]|nr:TlpA disulfide reductase family protein [Cellvibrio sp.]
MKFFAALASSLLISMSVSAADVGTPAPAFTVDALKNATAAKINLADYKGKVVYVDFWASWCGPCKRSFPKLEELRTKYKSKGFEVIAINMDEDLANANEFLKKIPVTFPVGTDPKGTIAQTYRVQGLPTAYIIDRQGAIGHVITGFNEKTELDTIEAAATKLLGN